MATHSIVLAWRIPQTEEPGRLQSMELQGVRQNWIDLAWVTNTSNILTGSFQLVYQTMEHHSERNIQYTAWQTTSDTFDLSQHFFHVKESKSVSCSAVSNKLQPHGLSLTRQFCLWNSSGKSTGVGSHSQGDLLNSGIEHGPPSLQGESLPYEPPRKHHTARNLQHKTWQTTYDTFHQSQHLLHTQHRSLLCVFQLCFAFLEIIKHNMPQMFFLPSSILKWLHKMLPVLMCFWCILIPVFTIQSNKLFQKKLKITKLWYSHLTEKTEQTFW